MKSIMNSRLLKWWVTPKLHTRYIEGPLESGDPWRITVTFFVHPIKRRIARLYLKILKGLFGLKVIGITGSAGKTTTKEMLGSILKRVGETVVTHANIDPVYNIPTTILKCRPATKFLVLEMGVEYKGDMDFYLWLADIDVAVITNILKTHTQFFGDEKGVFQEKARILSGLNNDGFAILNKDSKYFSRLKRLVKSGMIITFGKNADVSYKDIKIDDQFKTSFKLSIGDQSVDVKLPILGEQFVENAAAVAAVAKSFGVGTQKIVQGLKVYPVPSHRMEVFKVSNNNILIDDAYNNNPFAATRAIDMFTKYFKGYKKIVVFGDMLELGRTEKQDHKQIGQLLSQSSISTLVAVGDLAKITARKFARKKGKKSTYLCQDAQCALNTLVQDIKPKNAAILVKGSRKLQLEKVVEGLM